MELYYKSSKMKTSCSSEKESNKKWGHELAKKVRLRLTELAGADVLSVISHLPPPRLHQLENNRKGQFAVVLQGPYRLVFEPYHDPVPTNPDGGIDLTKITKILVLEVIDYHGS